MTWTASSYWAAWVADCGPYVGPWPPAPPIPANLPDSSVCSQIDYLLVNDTLANVVAGSYSATNLDLYRYWTTAPNTRANTGIGTPTVTGAHLFVIYTRADGSTTTAPAEDAFTLVPALYVSGGAGTNVPDPSSGHWSAWQPFPASLETGGASADTVLKRAIAAAVSQSGIVDVTPLESTVLHEAVTGTVAETTGGGGYVQLAMSAVKGSSGGATSQAIGSCNVLSIGNNSTVTESQIDLELTPDGLPPLSQLLPSVDPSGSFIEGIDYAGNPSQAGSDLQGVNYDGNATTPVTNWGTVALACRVQGVKGNGLTAATLTYDTVSVRFAQVNAARPVAAWTADGAGTTLDTEAIGQTGVTSRTVNLDLSAAPITGFYVNGQIAGYSTLGPPVADWAWAGGQDQHSAGWALSVDSVTLAPVLVWPQYRYWIPGGSAPFLRTVGGHFRTVGGAEVYMKQPDGHWERIVHGSTPGS